jgi:hypothetical protein
MPKKVHSRRCRAPRGYQRPQKKTVGQKMGPAAAGRHSVEEWRLGLTTGDPPSLAAVSLSTNKDSAAAAAAGRKEPFFDVPERMGTRAVAASGAGGLSLEELFLPGWAMGRGSRVAAGSDYLDFKLDWLRCFAALSTYKDSAAAAAGRKELFFGVPERMGARAVAASGAGGEGDEGITLFQPYGLPLVHRSLYCRVLSLVPTLPLSSSFLRTVKKDKEDGVKKWRLRRRYERSDACLAPPLDLLSGEHSLIDPL